jgi:hypothetical protein
VRLIDFAGGLIKAAVYGIVVAVAGCLRGIQCGRSSAAVGQATTSAVVTSIVFIVVCMAILTVIYDALGMMQPSPPKRPLRRRRRSPTRTSWCATWPWPTAVSS